MLLAIKDRITGIIAWFVVILISVPFILWGVQEYTGIGQDKFAIKVNDSKISLQEFDREITRNRQQLLQSFGGRMPTYFDAESFLRTQTVAMMVNRELYKQLIEDNRYRVPVQQVLSIITSDPVFQTNGQFDPDAYAAELRSRGLSKQGYETLLRDQLLASQIQESIRKSAYLTREEVAEYAQLRYQNRDFEYVRIASEKYKQHTTKVSEQDIKAYYEKNSDRYKTEEKIRVEYIELSLAGMLAKVAVDEAQLESTYNTALTDGRFKTDEARNASHILIKVPDGASDEVVAEKRKIIEALRERILKGESFSKVAKEASEDPGSASRGGSLDDVQRGAMVKPFEDALFAAKPNSVTEPVKTQFGFHLILVNNIIEPKVQPFAEVRVILDEEYRRSQAEPMFYDLLDSLANSAFENPNDLAIVAETVGTEVKSSDWFTADKGTGIAENQAVRSTAFSDEVLKDGNNSAPFELEPEHVMVLRVAEHEPSRAKTLDEAREQITQTLQAQQASKALQEVVTAIVSAAENGESLSKLAQVHGGVYKRVETNRDDTDTPREVIQKVFTMHLSKPVDKTFFANGDAAILKLNKVVNGDVQWQKTEEQQKLVKELIQLRGQYDLAAVMDDLKERAEISIHPDLQPQQ
ncbi:MAG: SurA N-terminal domain-containing protein [Gammaproteobacteria bacterium]|nr:SurA N-terminal domain-containing protein [Gammaproteobacteria bacterium]